MPEDRLSSRKWLSLVGVFLTSTVFGWFRPEFVGTAANLFNFWLILLGLYFGANVAEKYNQLKSINGAAK